MKRKKLEINGLLFAIYEIHRDCLFLNVQKRITGLSEAGCEDVFIDIIRTVESKRTILFVSYLKLEENE